MKKILTYILLVFSLQIYSLNTFNCTDYERTTVVGNGGVVSISSSDVCNWTLNAIPDNGYKFAYWVDIDGNKLYESTISVSINTNYQNLAWQATFVRDNSFIFEWTSDSIVFQADTTDIFSGSTGGYTEVCLDNKLTSDIYDEISYEDFGVWSKRTRLTEGNINSGKSLRMIIYNDCNKPSAIIDTIVPTVVRGDSLISSMSIPSRTDIQVLNHSILTIDKNTIVDGCLDIHVDGKVIVNEGSTLEIDSIILRGNGILRQWAQLKVLGSVICEKIYYDYTLDSKSYYPLVLPTDVNCEDVVSTISKTVPSYQSFIYNPILREQGLSAWEEFDDTQEDAIFEAGKGYIIYAPSHKWQGNKSKRQRTSVMRFPLDLDLSGGEPNRSINIYSESSSDVTINDKNWNLIGIPYLSEFTTGSFTDSVKIIQGYYDWSSDHYEFLGNIRYVTYSTDGYRSYVQERLKNVTLEPFNTYFIQTVSGNSLLFLKEESAISAPRRGTSNYEIETGIVFTQDDRKDYIGLVFGDFTDEYDINADLIKEFGEDQMFTCYSLLENLPMSFIARSIDKISQPTTIGFRNASKNLIIISFDDKNYNRSDVRAIWLHDKLTNRTTNLLIDDYIFSTERSQDDARFSLFIEYYDTVTNLEYDFINSSTQIYDILGRRIKNLDSGVNIVITNNGIKKEIRL